MIMLCFSVCVCSRVGGGVLLITEMLSVFVTHTHTHVDTETHTHTHTHVDTETHTRLISLVQKRLLMHQQAWP